MAKTSYTTARYEMVTMQDGTVYAKTLTRWSISYGKCNRQDFHKSGEIYTKTRLRAWGKKYNVKIEESDIEMLPTKV